MSDTEYYWLSSLLPFGQSLVFLGIPVLMIAARAWFLKLPWAFCILISAVLIFLAAQVECALIDEPVGTYEMDHRPEGERLGLSDGGASFAALVFAFPMGLITTSVVFGIYYGGRWLMARRRSGSITPPG